MTTGYPGPQQSGASPGGRPTLGRYVLVREIARSNDVVWEGIDPTMNRRVAIKELALDPSATGQARRERIERFYREARAAGAMNHPNIVTIHEVGEDRGRFFIAMEYLEGQTLRERLSLVGVLPLNEAVAIASALSDALEYAHNQGVVHRDIKPDNIHILRGGQVKLTDFGIARIQHEQQLTMAGQVFGTPSYMSPEQVTGAPVDARADLFSLGIVLYEMLTGRKPFLGDSVPTITYKIIHEPTPPALGVAPEVEHVLQRAMVKVPEGRFQSAGEFRTALIQAAALQRSGGSFGASLSHGGVVPATAPVSGGFSGATMAGPPPFPAAASLPPAAPASNALYTAATPYPDYGAGSAPRRSLAATLGLIALFAGLLGGAGWAVSTAFNNQQIQAGYSRGEQAYARAVQLYEQKKYTEAAGEFGKVRRTAGVRADTAGKAAQGEVYSYRMLGQQAQASNNLPTAESWFQKAVDLAPTDAQALEELAAIRKLRGLTTPAGPSDQARLNGAVNTRGSDLQHAIPPEQTPLAGLIDSRGGTGNGSGSLPAPNTPTMPGQRTTSDFTGDNARKAQEASRLLAAGEEALKRGDRDGALRMYHAAVAAGPGSPAAIQAQAQITRYSYSDPLSGI